MDFISPYSKWLEENKYYCYEHIVIGKSPKMTKHW